MIDARPQSRLFEAFSRELLREGKCVRFEARGASMSPAIRDGEMVLLKAVDLADLRVGDIVLSKGEYGFRLHRLVVADVERDVFITRGECGVEDDPAVGGEAILGIAAAKEVRVGRSVVRAKLRGASGRLVRCLARGEAGFRKISKWIGTSGAKAQNNTSPFIAALKALRHPKAATKAATQAGTRVDTAANRAAKQRANQAVNQAASQAASQAANRAAGVGHHGLVSTASTWKSLGRILSSLILIAAAGQASAQVAVDATTFGVGSLTGPGPVNLAAFAHTTGVTTNRLLIVGVSINITNSPTAGVTGVTYNGTALSFVGAHNDAGNTRRVEMWYLKAPANGIFNVVVSVNVPGAVTVGVVAGATTFTGVDQTVPLGTFVSAHGAGATNSQLDVPSVVNGMVLDTLAIAGNVAATVPAPQVAQWNQQSSNDANPGVRGTGSTRAGAPSVPISETFAASNWSLGAVSINPTAADIGVSTSVGTVFLGQNTVYTITVTNNGPSAANGVTLTDALAPGPTLVSVVPSAGTTCLGTGPINCTLPTPLNSGASATVTVTVTAATSGSYSNTAMISDSGTPPDPNTGNNSYTAVATVQSAACATTAQAAAGNTLGAVVNTYYPGTASVAAGATTIPLGVATGAGSAIATGNLLLVIQMQDATLNLSNSVAYGNGSTGSGFTALNNAGNYEFVRANGNVPATGGALPIVGAGAGGGLVFGYNSAAVSATQGPRTYQVVLIPQYTTATLGATLTASAWNGSTGGVLALDASSTLTLGGVTVSVDGKGFRGGAGMQLQGGGGLNTDFLQTAPATYTGVAKPGWDAPKGEGIAGTPAWVESGVSFLATGTSYPNGAAGVDGSMARGAPGNAGGGGTDADPQRASPSGNDQNAGGGGGGNGGSGGFGGDSWNSNLSLGGEGGSIFPATINRLALGGGGGGGTRNNSPGDARASGGAPGGGIIIIRANALSGTATLTSNGLSAYNGTLNDAGGGGAGGGSIVVLSANGGEGGLTLQANGGRGGDAWDIQPYSLADRHGPGGGGGGGVVMVSAAPASISVSGGTSGTTLNPGVPYGATAGAPGTSVTNASITSTSGTQSGAQCTPDMTLGKSHVGNFTRGSNASYTIPVQNVSPFGASSGSVTINDTLPVGVTPTSASGAGWSCSVASQTVSCVRADSLAGSSSYPSITINVSVAQTAPATVTNTAVVSGGGEINLANDSATDVASVVSTADMSVTDAASPNPVAAGSNITYTQVVTNNGPSAADNATVVAGIPANTTFVSLTAPAGWSCITPAVGATGNVVCSNANMAGSTNATFTLVVKVNNGTANGTVITGTVNVNSAVSDPNSGNNTASASVVVGTASPDLSVTNGASPNPVVAGNNITYTQVVTNTGSSPALGGSFTEATPANTTFVSITPPAGWTCLAPPPVNCTNPSVAAGSSATFTVVYKVNAGTASGTIITDTATVGATNDAFAGDNSATATDVVATAGQADLALSTAATPPTVLAGNDISYTQTVTNNGPAAASTVSFVEPIPTNTTFVSVSAPAGWTCTVTASVTCTNPSVAAGTSADIIVVVNVAPTVAAGTITANSSVSSSVTTDPTAANNSTVVTTNVNVACDLTVTNTGVPNPVAAGSNITYTQTVKNNGPSNCSTVTFTEATPANTTFVSITPPAGWTCAGFPPTCTNPTVAAGSSGTFTVVYNVNAGTTAGTIITDTATASTPTRDTNTADNSATMNIAVAGAGQADLSVTNTASPNPVSAGSNITYTQVVTNGGPAAAVTVTLTDAVPANTTFVSLTGPAGWACSGVTFTCTNPSVGSGATATFTFVVKVNATVASGTTITDTVSVASASTSDPNAANNSASTNVTVGTSADLSVTNSAAPVPVQANNNITYTQVVSNAGPSNTGTITLSETLPPNTVAQSLTGPAGWTCILAALTCTNSTLAAGGNATFTYVVKVNAGTAAGTAINETASVSSTTSDPNSANNSAVAADVVATGAQADLVTTNSAAPSSVAAGSNVTYTQSVTNLGPAVATTVSFTQSTPPNTNFQSITPPAGWTCGTQPPIGGTGTITCTIASLAVNATANFTLVLQVNAATPSGTTIAETATATATNIVPGLTTNSATATVVVANANSADVAITKTATPNPVAQGDILTYTLSVVNNGPASATNVTAADTLPSAVTFLSVTTTTGTCSEAGGTVTCLLGTMANAATATITVVTLAGTPGVVSNTATVVADQTDSNLNNNSSTQTETITAPTSVQLQFFKAASGTDKNGASRVVLTWKTGGESHNLGFNVYREVNGNRVRLNNSLIAGSALLMRGALPQHSGKIYNWIDPSVGAAGEYWLEDVDVSGTRTMHGAVTSAGALAGVDAGPAPASTFSQLSQAQASYGEQSRSVEAVAAEFKPSSGQIQKQFALAAHPAVKILVRHEGWYRVTQPDLLKAGLDPNVDPASLRLFAEAVEQSIQITGATAGRGGFGSEAAINFYGTGIDTVYSGTRAYWLVAGDGSGARIPQMQASSGSNLPPSSFPATVELRQHSTYFSALLTPNGDNFFGALVSPTAVDQLLTAPHLDPASTLPARIEILLQGVVVGVPHDVVIALNGTTLGDITFTGQDKGRFQLSVPPGVLLPGNNTVTLIAQNGPYDISLVEYIRIAYPHSYVADSDELKFSGRAGDELRVSGFAIAPAAVVDITDPTRPVLLTPHVTSQNGKYEIAMQVPWTTTNPAAPTRHTLLAMTDDGVANAAAVRPNHPSHWHSAQAGAEIAMVTYEDFAAALAPLVTAHQAEGKSSAVVPINDLYDEFNFGERSPFVIRQFLQSANANWKTAPKYLLLNGRASIDPRNYLGFGHLDLVPTKIVPTPILMTASDDWFSDFTDSGMPTVATGRLPVSSVDEANTVIGKIAAYAGQSTNGPWTGQALIVADKDDAFDTFTSDSQATQAQLPAAMQVTDVFTTAVGVDAARQQIIDGINSGQLLVNYLGHGSEEQWSGSNIFDTTSLTSLTNGSQLPVFFIMDCLNGFFQDVYQQPLGVALLLAPNGGAVAVLASSGLNQPVPQAKLDKLVVQQAMNPARPALGEAILKAKAFVGDPAVRRTYVLLGDPAMRVKAPGVSATAPQ